MRPPRPAGLLIHTSQASETVHIATECPTSMLQCISTAPPCSAEKPESKRNARESKPLSAVSKALGLPLSRGKRGKSSIHRTYKRTLERMSFGLHVNVNICLKDMWRERQFCRERRRCFGSGTCAPFGESQRGMAAIGQSFRSHQILCEHSK